MTPNRCGRSKVQERCATSGGVYATVPRQQSLLAGLALLHLSRNSCGYKHACADPRFLEISAEICRLGMKVTARVRSFWWGAGRSPAKKILCCHAFCKARRFGGERASRACTDNARSTATGLISQRTSSHRLLSIDAAADNHIRRLQYACSCVPTSAAAAVDHTNTVGRHMQHDEHTSPACFGEHWLASPVDASDSTRVSILHLAHARPRARILDPCSCVALIQVACRCRSLCASILKQARAQTRAPHLNSCCTAFVHIALR